MLNISLRSVGLGLMYSSAPVSSSTQQAPAKSDVYSLLKVWLSGLRLVMQQHVFQKAWNMHIGRVRLVTSSCQAGRVNMRFVA